MDQLYKYETNNEILNSHIKMIEELKKYYVKDCFFNNLICEINKQISKNYENNNTDNKFGEDIEVFIKFVVHRVLLHNFNLKMFTENLDKKRNKKKINFDAVLKSWTYCRWTYDDTYKIEMQVPNISNNIIFKNENSENKDRIIKDYGLCDIEYGDMPYCHNCSSLKWRKVYDKEKDRYLGVDFQIVYSELNCIHFFNKTCKKVIRTVGQLKKQKSIHRFIVKSIMQFNPDLFIKNKIFMLCKNGKRFHFDKLKGIEKIAYDLIETEIISQFYKQFPKTKKYATSKQ